MILLLVLARLIYRLSHGAPPDEPTLTWWQKGAAHVTHWGLYLLLLVVPIIGYVGISLYPARDIFGLFSLPGIVAQNQDAAARVLYWHWVGAVAIVLLVGMHVGAALFHYLIRKDGVLQRMLRCEPGGCLKLSISRQTAGPACRCGRRWRRCG